MYPTRARLERLVAERRVALVDLQGLRFNQSVTDRLGGLL